MAYKTLIVGLGKIGMMYNFSNSSINFSNHCDIFSNTNGFKLAAAVDIKSSKRRLFKKKFKLPVFNNLISASKNIQFDIVVISVPTLHTEKIYNQIISLKIKPKIFILEKPGSYNYKTLKSFYLYCKKNKINIFMNYTRNFAKKLHLIDKFLKISKIGNVNTIEIDYSKGLYNSCSHYLSFLNRFYEFNKITNIKCDHYFTKNHDFFGNFIVKSKINLKFNYKKNCDEKICIYGTKAKLEYYTEKNQIYFASDKKKTKINNDFRNEQKNMINFVKKNFYLRSKCYKIFHQNITILKIINQICQKIQKIK
jgi:hypothetical protein